MNICPECEQGKHGNCTGEALDEATDSIVPCGCPHLAAVPTPLDASDELGEVVERIARRPSRSRSRTARLRLAWSHRRCGYRPWACSDGWFCGGCGGDWDLDGRRTDAGQGGGS